MHKEIHEQPQVLRHLCTQTNHASLEWKNAKTLHLTACGTSLYAAQTAAAFFERWAHLPTLVASSSEVNQKKIWLDPNAGDLFPNQVKRPTHWRPCPRQRARFENFLF